MNIKYVVCLFNLTLKSTVLYKSMPKRKKNLEEVVEELEDEIKTAEIDADREADPQDEIEKKREELIKLAEDGQFDKSVKTIKKASNKVIEKYYNEYERKRMQKANEFITDQLTSKFADALGSLDATEKPEVLSEELRKDDLLKSNVIKIVEMISPYIPCLGFLSGGITTGKHIYDHKKNKINKLVQIPTENNKDI